MKKIDLIWRKFFTFLIVTIIFLLAVTIFLLLREVTQLRAMFKERRQKLRK